MQRHEVVIHSVNSHVPYLSKQTRLPVNNQTQTEDLYQVYTNPCHVSERLKLSLQSCNLR